MLAKVHSGAIVGLEGVPIVIEVDIIKGTLPSFTIVGLPDKAVEESRERVRSAIKNSGADFPTHRITVNLAPADLPKVGPVYDLPIALGILVASGQVPVPPEDALFFGELSLDGTLRHSNGVLSLTVMAEKNRYSAVYVPLIDGNEASMLEGVAAFPVPSLLALVRHLTKHHTLTARVHTPFQLTHGDGLYDADMQDIYGQQHVKRALEIAAAGGHNVFLFGPPGAGKTMLARTFPTILPPFTEQEAIEVTRVYSVTGNLPMGTSIMTSRPFRSPHHTTSRIGLIGGGSTPMPGEISLAHRGVLFLDEFPEFPRNVIEAMRQPMEDGVVTISRAIGTVVYPSKFLLLAAANPCPCGNFGSTARKCTCMPGAVSRYRKKISGPLLDRIDIHVSVPAVATESLIAGGDHSGLESSRLIRERVVNARSKQTARFRTLSIVSNSEMTTKMIKGFSPLSHDVYVLLEQAMSHLHMSARGYYRTVKIAQTIADLDGSSEISSTHVAEALQYRSIADWSQ